jgi:hypothetical protein
MSDFRRRVALRRLPVFYHDFILGRILCAVPDGVRRGTLFEASSRSRLDL